MPKKVNGPRPAKVQARQQSEIDADYAKLAAALGDRALKHRLIEAEMDHLTTAMLALTQETALQTASPDAV